MVERRIDVLEIGSLTIEEAVRWADGVAGSAAWLAAHVLEPGPSSASAIPAGRVWGLHLLASDGRADRAQVQDRLRAERPLARQAARRLNAIAFPAVAYAALANAAPAAPALSPLQKRLRLL